MKPFIVFLALLIVNVSFLSFHSDMTRYEKLQVYLKAAAEEAACGGALFQDEEAYGRGVLAIKENEAQNYVNFVMEQTESELQKSIAGKVEYEVEIFDDQRGYDRCEEYGLKPGTPAVRVSMLVTCRDLFRLPFLRVEQIRRSSVYQWQNFPHEAVS